MNKLDQNRNPVILPDEEPKKQGCPKCHGMNFNGRKVQGVITFKCGDCKNEWAGGLPQEPVDPRIPRQPENPLSAPAVSFNKHSKTGQVIEERRSVSLTQEFRKGAPLPAPGEEDV